MAANEKHTMEIFKAIPVILQQIHDGENAESQENMKDVWDKLNDKEKTKITPWNAIAVKHKYGEISDVFAIFPIVLQNQVRYFIHVNNQKRQIISYLVNCHLPHRKSRSMYGPPCLEEQNMWDEFGNPQIQYVHTKMQEIQDYINQWLHEIKIFHDPYYVQVIDGDAKQPKIEILHWQYQRRKYQYQFPPDFQTWTEHAMWKEWTPGQADIKSCEYWFKRIAYSMKMVPVNLATHREIETWTSLATSLSQCQSNELFAGEDGMIRRAELIGWWKDLLKCHKLDLYFQGHTKYLGLGQAFITKRCLSPEQYYVQILNWITQNFWTETKLVPLILHHAGKVSESGTKSKTKEDIQIVRIFLEILLPWDNDDGSSIPIEVELDLESLNNAVEEFIIREQVNCFDCYPQRLPWKSFLFHVYKPMKIMELIFAYKEKNIPDIFLHQFIQSWSNQSWVRSTIDITHWTMQDSVVYAKNLIEKWIIWRRNKNRMRGWLFHKTGTSCTDVKDSPFQPIPRQNFPDWKQGLNLNIMCRDIKTNKNVYCWEVFSYLYMSEDINLDQARVMSLVFAMLVKHWTCARLEDHNFDYLWIPQNTPEQQVKDLWRSAVAHIGDKNHILFIAGINPQGDFQLICTTCASHPLYPVKHVLVSEYSQRHAMFGLQNLSLFLSEVYCSGNNQSYVNIIAPVLRAGSMLFCGWSIINACSLLQLGYFDHFNRLVKMSRMVANFNLRRDRYEEPLRLMRDSWERVYGNVSMKSLTKAMKQPCNDVQSDASQNVAALYQPFIFLPDMAEHLGLNAIPPWSNVIEPPF